MRAYHLTTLLCAGFFCLPAFAADTSADAARQYHEAAITQVRAKLALARADATKAKVMGSHTGSGTPLANEYRAYPPSCAAWPLPDKSSGTTVSKRMALYTRDGNGNSATPETVTVTLWRVPCSSSGASNLPYNNDSAGNAMTLLRIDRDSGNEGRTDRFPTFPLLNIRQGNLDFGNQASAVRAASEPNTFVTDGPYDAPVFVSTTYVLENYNFAPAYNHFYAYAFTLLVDPYISGGSGTTFAMGDYTGTGLTSMPLDGYAAAQYYNASLNEGLLVQVAEGYDGAHPARRQVILDLLTTDNNNAPFWIVGNVAYDNIGATTLNVPLTYLVNGNATQPWGSASISLLSCGKLRVVFHANSGLPSPVPSFNGTADYDRIFAANGMMCE